MSEPQTDATPEAPAESAPQSTAPKKDAAYYRRRQREVQRKQLYRKYGVSGPAQPLNTWTMAVRLLALMLTMAAFGIGYYFYTAFGL